MNLDPIDLQYRLGSVEKRLAGERAHLADLEADLATRKAVQRAKIREDAQGGADYPPARREDDAAGVYAAERDLQRQRNAVEILTELGDELTRKALRWASGSAHDGLQAPAAEAVPEVERGAVGAVAGS